MRVSSFHRDGYKSIACSACGAYTGRDSRLADNKPKMVRCPCGTVTTIYPPRKTEVNGKPVIVFGNSAPEQDPMASTYTADLG